jgi:hypothetical protein
LTRITQSEFTATFGLDLKFNSNEQVFYHRDYWDAAEELLQKIPVIGLPMRWLRKRFEVNSQ